MNNIPTKEDRNRRAFTAICEFVHQLNNTFGSKTKALPIGLYSRLIEKVVIGDAPAIDRFVKGFRIFFDKYQDAVVNNELETIPSGTTIRYYGDTANSDRIFIPIERYIRTADATTKTAIRQHLLAICMHTSDKNTQAMMEALKDALNTPINSDILAASITPKEQEFIDLLEKKAKLYGEKHQNSNLTPDELLRSALDDGLISEITDWLTVNASSFDMTRLVGLIQNKFMKML